MSRESSPPPTLSHVNAPDSEEVSSTTLSSTPMLTLAPAFEDASLKDSEALQLRSAFRTISGGPLSMQQRLLAMLHNELPQPWRSLPSDPCTTTVENSSAKHCERKEGEKESDYLERRRKNNDSARRSREVRRHRETLNRRQVEVLEKENVQLRAQIALLRLEVTQLSLVLMGDSVKPLS